MEFDRFPCLVTQSNSSNEILVMVSWCVSVCSTVMTSCVPLTTYYVRQGFVPQVCNEDDVRTRLIVPDQTVMESYSQFGMASYGLQNGWGKYAVTDTRKHIIQWALWTHSGSVVRVLILRVIDQVCTVLSGPRKGPFQFTTVEAQLWMVRWLHMK